MNSRIHLEDSSEDKVADGFFWQEFWQTLDQLSLWLPLESYNIKDHVIGTQGCLGPLGLVFGTQIHLDLGFPEKYLTMEEYMIFDLEFIS